MSQKNKNPKDKKKSEGAAVTQLRPTTCLSESCHEKGTLFGFCSTHYEQFKFGLIKKNGQKVLDYEKKLKHYEAYQERLSTRKVA